MTYNYAKWMKDCRDYPTNFGRKGEDRVVWLYDCVVKERRQVTASEDLWHAASPTIGWAYMLTITWRDGSKSVEGPIPERLVRPPDPSTGKHPENFWIDSGVPRAKGANGVYIVPM